MYKFVIVTDSDRASGFRLAGVEVLEAGSSEEAKKVISPLLFKDDVGIVAVNEEYMLDLDGELRLQAHPIVLLSRGKWILTWLE